MKILLVEDSATLRHAMCKQIREAGHETVVAKSGEEALQLVETTPVDLVIMDVEMPGLNGFETTQLMRESFGEHWVPIIFVTGMSDDASFHEGIEVGGDDYMIKPISPVILRAKIRALERITEMRDQLRRLNRELRALSQRDGLTQLYNRRTFEEKLQQQWQILTRAQDPVALVMIDVDHFKTYNDTYGHPAGDACLKQVAEALQQALHRPADLLARYGGEEFIALLPQTDLAGARTVTAGLTAAVTALALPHKTSSCAEIVTVSIGAAATSHTTGLSPEELIRQADKALYRAKHNGRNRAEVVELHGHKTVLIVDDEAASVALISEALRQQFNLLSTASATECLEIAHNIHPDLILLAASVDDGKVCRALKEHRNTAAIPVVVLASAEANDQCEAASGRLEKPLQAQQLMAAVNRLLE